MYRSLLFAFVLLISGCATTGVNVVHINTPDVGQVSTPVAFVVSGEHEPTVYASRQALGSSSNVYLSQVSHGSWKLRVDAAVSMEHRSSQDPYCSRFYPGYMGPWVPGGPYYGYHGFNPLYCDRIVRAAPVRTITWTVENAQGRLVWQASARDLNPAGPPVDPSQRLARALDQWLEQQK